MYADRFTRPILAAMIVCTLPHFAYVAPWVVMACVLLWGYAWAATARAWPLPSGWGLKATAGILFTAAMTTHERFTIEAFVALLALMAGLKLLEIRTRRDRMITVILCYFLIAGGLFFKDSIGATLYLLLSILVTTAVLIHVNGSARGASASLKISGVLMAQAAPLMLVLFLLFPRVPGGIWGRAHLNTARTGFGDQIELGDVAALARTTDVAFRVEFEGKSPARDRLYWRGAVLWEFDGSSWRRGRGHQDTFVRTPGSGRGTAYTVTLEPHNEHWLLGLDLPLAIESPGTRLLRDHSVYRWRPVTSRVTYRVTSDPDATSLSLPRFDREKALELPPVGNARSRAMARAWIAEAANEEEYVGRVLTFFRQEPFFYTLHPPPLVRNEETHGAPRSLIDAFLFESRRGFCEHYAASFAFLMRAAGIPARLVVGYQGGVRNQYGGYLVVRQSEAHAWSEVWLSGKGWVRVDPTSAVAPERVMGDVIAALPPEEAAGMLSFLERGPLGEWLTEMKNILDYWNAYWNRWVMTYSVNEQAGLLSRIGVKMTGGEDVGKILLAALVTAILLVVAISLVIFREPRAERDETAEAWLSFCRKLSRIGLHRDPAQGPIAYLAHIASRRPDLTDRAREIVFAYVQARYREDSTARDIQSLQAMIKRFSPSKAKV